MPRGDKSSYSNRQKRKAEHIEQGYEKRGVGRKQAERRAWATVNKQEGGGKKSGSGRKPSSSSSHGRSSRSGSSKSRTSTGGRSL
ncbi:MAG: plasmid stabilization protein [Tepidisphaeraceae bacterium]